MKDTEKITHQEQNGVKNDSGKLPYYEVLFTQLPNATEALVTVAYFGHLKLGPIDKDWLNIMRLEDAKPRLRNALLRHLIKEDAASDDFEGAVTHAAQVAFNAMALLEIILREKMSKCSE